MKINLDIVNDVTSKNMQNLITKFFLLGATQKLKNLINL
jgi:hypothetical protein